MTPNERPTPIVDSLCADRGEPKSGLIWADDARKLERSLADRTEERDECIRSTKIDVEIIMELKVERYTALAKLAKCREALELFDLGVGLGVTEEMYDKRKSALEETK